MAGNLESCVGLPVGALKPFKREELGCSDNSVISLSPHRHFVEVFPRRKTRPRTILPEPIIFSADLSPDVPTRKK
jgi:hypothetical protein